MVNGYNILLISLLAVLGKSESTEDKPCFARKEEAGFICVCNRSYCDTINYLSPPPGIYYHYTTSDTSPGFTKNSGEILNSSAEVERTFNNISSDVYIWINSDIQYQTFSGVGASLTDSSALLINSLPTDSQQNLMQSFFGRSGLGYTFVRVPIACSDFSPEPYTYDDVPGDVKLEHFNLTEEDFKLKIPLLKQAMNLSERGLKLIATAWTAPSWMKTNNESSPGYIHTKYLQVWTEYHLKFLAAYNEFGIDFWGLSQGNEVIIPLYFGSFFMIPNTIMLPSQARYWTKKYLGPLLKNSEFKNIKILTLDDERPFIPWWSNRMFGDQEAAQYIDGIALHWYFDSVSTLPELDAFHMNYPDKFILYTESSINSFQSGGGAVYLGSWARAARYINNIFRNFGHWVVGYIDWNMVLDEDGGPTGPGNITLDASVITNTTSGEFYKQPLFYVLGHFSKFIHPGSKKINVTIKQDTIEENYEVFKKNYMEFFGMNFEDPTTTESPFPTKKPEPPSNTVIALATVNPDGTCSIIAYNPRPEPVNLHITDPKVGEISETILPLSLNTFIYLLPRNITET